MSDFVGNCLSQVVVGSSSTGNGVEAVRSTRQLVAVSMKSHLSIGEYLH